MPRWVKWHSRMGAVVERSIPKWLPRRVRNLLRNHADRKAWAPYRAWCDRWYARHREIERIAALRPINSVLAHSDPGLTFNYEPFCKIVDV